MKESSFIDWLKGYLEDKVILDPGQMDRIKKKLEEVQQIQPITSPWLPATDRVIFPGVGYPWSQPTITCAVNNGAVQ